jgi:hypothetical protein
MIDWKAFYANGGYLNENSDPLSYDDGVNEDELEELEDSYYEDKRLINKED